MSGRHEESAEKKQSYEIIHLKKNLGLKKSKLVLQEPIFC
jgi:hypothetical protein